MVDTQTREAVGSFTMKRLLQDAADELLINANHADLSCLPATARWSSALAGFRTRHDLEDKPRGVPGFRDSDSRTEARCAVGERSLRRGGVGRMVFASAERSPRDPRWCGGGGGRCVIGVMLGGFLSRSTPIPEAYLDNGGLLLWVPPRTKPTTQGLGSCAARAPRTRTCTRCPSPL